MRVLCLYFSEPIEKSLAEAFLLISPQVVFREEQWIFINIESTSHLHGGEYETLRFAERICQRLGLKEGCSVQLAIAKTPYLAQVLAKHRPYYITEPNEDLSTMNQLPLLIIADLEGLHPWPKPRQLEVIIQFFNNLGLHGIDDVKAFRAESFRERWGEVGISLWKRLHLLESQPISPLVSKQPFVDYHFFDFSVSQLPILINSLEILVSRLFSRLDGLGRFAQKMQVHLYCEFSEIKHFVQIEPVTASRDAKLFLDLFYKKIEKLDLQNPIKEIEIEILDVPEKVLQLDMFEPRDSSQDKWQRLVSFARQSNVKMGFLQMTAEHFPEDSFFLKTDLPVELKCQDEVLQAEDAVQVKAAYAKLLSKSPRPSLILPQPKPILKSEVQSFRFLTSLPMERLSATWWKSEEHHTGRDYFFVMTKQSQVWWIFKEHTTGNFFLQGAFD